MVTKLAKPVRIIHPVPGSEDLGALENASWEHGFRGFVLFCAEMVRAWLTHNAMQMAAAIAFYSFFSLFPLALLIIMGYDLLNPAGQVPEEQMTHVIGTFIPVSQGVIARTIQSVADRWDWRAAGPLALTGLVWASTAVFATLRKGINATWGIWTPRPFLKERFMDLSLTAGAGILFMAMLFSISMFRSFSESDGVLGGPVWKSAASLALTFGTFSLIYWFLPNRRLRFKDIVFGAAVASMAFEVAKGFFLLYVARRQGVNQVYGDLTDVAVLLGWLYLSAALILIGSLITVIYTGLVQRGIASHADIWSFGLIPIIRKIRRRLSILAAPDPEG